MFPILPAFSIPVSTSLSTVLLARVLDEKCSALLAALPERIAESHHMEDTAVFLTHPGEVKARTPKVQRAGNRINKKKLRDVLQERKGATVTKFEQF